MRPKPERTAYGERVFLARKHAKMTQTALAKAVGMSQGTLAEAEKLAMGSVFTAQIAKVTGVNAEWLATGVGHMLGFSVTTQSQLAAQEPPAAYITPAQAIAALRDTLAAVEPTVSERASSLLGSLASDPHGPWAGWLTELFEKSSSVRQRADVNKSQDHVTSSSYDESAPVGKSEAAVRNPAPSGDAHFYNLGEITGEPSPKGKNDSSKPKRVQK